MFSILKYFTLFNVLLVVGHKYTHQYINILFTSVLVSVFGFMFFNICPAKLKFRLLNRDIELSGIPLSLLDIIYHQFPTLFVIYWYLSYYRKNPFGLSFLTALAIIVIYHIIVRDAIDIYGCYDEQKLIIANLVVISLYSILIYVSAPK